MPAKVKSSINQLIQNYGNSFVTKNASKPTSYSTHKVKLNLRNTNKNLSVNDMKELSRSTII